MSDPTTDTEAPGPEEVSGGVMAPAPADRLARAAAALGGDEPEEEVIGEPEEEPEDAGDDSDDDDEPDERPSSKGRKKPMTAEQRLAMARRKAEQIDKRERALAERERSLEASLEQRLEAKLAQLTEQVTSKADARAAELDKREQELTAIVEEMRRGDPGKGLEALARMGGLDPKQAYERLTRWRMNDGKPDDADTFAMLREMQQQHAEEIRKLREELTEGPKRQAQQTREQALADGVTALSSLHEQIRQTKPEGYAILPRLSPYQFEVEAKLAVQAILDNGQRATAQQVAKWIDDKLADQYGLSQPTEAAGDDAEGEPGTANDPAGDSDPPGLTPKKAARKRSTSNRAAATGTSPARRRTPQERLEAAARALSRPSR